VPQIGDVLARMDSLLVKGNAMLDEENQDRVTSLLANADATLAALPGAIEQGRALMTRVDAVLTELEATSATLRTEVSAVASESRATLSALRPPLQSALATARTSLDELRTFVRQLRLAPDSMLFGIDRPAQPAGGDR